MSPFLALCPILADILLKLSLPPLLCLRISRCLTCSQLTVISTTACSVLNSSSSLRPPPFLPPFSSAQELLMAANCKSGCLLNFYLVLTTAPLFHPKFPERLLPANLLSLGIFQMFAETLPSANEHNIPVSISISSPLRLTFHCKMQEY